MAIPTHYVALSSYLSEHVRTEQFALDAYEEILRDRPDDVAGYLLNIILGDEHRHHELFGDMQRNLESRIAWRDEGPQVPSRVIKSDVEALQQATKNLLRLEKADAKELRRLRRTWRKRGGERELWALLVRTAELDTKKHIEILKYLRKLLDEAQE